VPPGAHHKSAALSTSEIFLQEFKVKEDHVSCLFEDIRIKSNLKITIKHSQTEMGFDFHCRS